MDFVATKDREKEYIQVCYLLASEDTVAREYGALASLPDNFPKRVLSMDTVHHGKREGIHWQNIIDFLMEAVSGPAH